MKRISLLLLAFISSIMLNFVQAQCLPCLPPNPDDYKDPITGKYINGFYPPSDTAYVGQAFDQEIKIVFPFETTSGPITRFTEFRIDSIRDIPDGLTLTLDDSDSVYYPLSTSKPAVACAHVCGTPTTANNVTDSVKVYLFAKTQIGFNGSAQAKYHLRVLPAVSKQKAWSLGLKYEVYPNPTRSQATLHYAVDRVTNVTVSMLDLTGKVLNYQYFPARTPGDYYLPLIHQPLPNGIYFVKIKTDEGEISHKLVIQE